MSTHRATLSQQDPGDARIGQAGEFMTSLSTQRCIAMITATTTTMIAKRVPARD